MSDLIKRDDAIRAVQDYFAGKIAELGMIHTDKGDVYDIDLVEPMADDCKRLEVKLRIIPSASQKVTGNDAWNMFELISSTFYGKQYYFLEECGLAYSRASAKHMSVDEAYQEFLDMIGGEDG